MRSGAARKRINTESFTERHGPLWYTSATNTPGRCARALSSTVTRSRSSSPDQASMGARWAARSPSRMCGYSLPASPRNSSSSPGTTRNTRRRRGPSHPQNPICTRFPLRPLSATARPSRCHRHGRVDHEAELVVVIGRRCRSVTEEEAPGCVGAYLGTTYRRGRNGDAARLRPPSPSTPSSLGPWLVTDLDLSDLLVECIVSGE